MRYRPYRSFTSLALAVILTATATGCRATPGISNGSVSVCYRAIPVARGAIHDSRAKLIGVHRDPVDKVRNQLPQAAQSELATDDDTSVCTMAFKGTFQAGQVDLAPADQSGGYALVLVSSKKLYLVATIVLVHLPHAFGGRTL
jgi:hypothetical protein